VKKDAADNATTVENNVIVFSPKPKYFLVGESARFAIILGRTSVRESGR